MGNNQKGIVCHVQDCCVHSSVVELKSSFILVTVILLRHFISRAKAVVEYRQTNGDFYSREELKKVKGIGEKVFVQCSGYIRIRSSGVEPAGSKKVSVNPLDATSIHPESYGAATALIRTAGCSLAELGSPDFRQKIRAYIAKREPELALVAAELKVGLPTLQLILDVLGKPVEHDLREEFAEPLFRSTLTRLEDVSPGSQLTGRVSNVTDFGAFVDLGLGKDGLLHVRYLPR